MAYALLSPGAPVGDQYEIIEPIPGLADPARLSLVYRGRDRVSGQPVMVRVCAPESPEGDRVKTRFIQEARSASRLSHPNLMPVLDYGLLDQDGSPYMVQPWEGVQTLEVALAQGGPMPPAEALSLMDGLLAGLAAAHARGLINRTIEPTNLLLTVSQAGPKLKIMTFGALFMDDTAIDRMTRTGQLVGSARYLAPEYIEEGQVSPSMDLYQAGLVLVEMLSGKPAVEANDAVGCVLAHTRGQLRIPEAVARSPLGMVLQRALDRDPRARHPNAEAMRQALLGVDVQQVASAQTTPDSAASEDILAGRFRVLSRLGEGGFGEVFRAEHMRTGLPLAIKVMSHRPDPEMHKAFKARFLREAQSAARISHPNVVTIHHYGLLPDDRPYIVMELLDGWDLDAELEDHGPMDPDRLLPMFCEALDALGEAHKQQIVHKDLKPGNLFLTYPGKRWEMIKLLDFGIARVGQGEEARLTQSGRMLFTCNYVAPEYIESQMAVPQTDVYQMGLILAELLTGQIVVDGEQLECIMTHMSGNYTLPGGLERGPLGPVLKRALSRDPAQRYEDGAAFAQALREVLSIRVGDTVRADQPPVAPQAAPEAPRARVAVEETVDGDLDALSLIQHLTQLNEMSNRAQMPVPEMQELIRTCLEIGQWRPDSPELGRIEQILRRMMTAVMRQPTLGDQSRNRRLMSLLWRLQGKG